VPRLGVWIYSCWKRLKCSQYDDDYGDDESNIEDME